MRVYAVRTDGNMNEDVIITKPFGNGRMTCREIRRNSAGCLKFRDECQKCKEIQHIGKHDSFTTLTLIQKIRNMEHTLLNSYKDF